MAIRSALAATALLALASQVRASHISYPHVEGITDNPHGSPLPYVMLLPPGYDEPDANLPLVVFMHGAGLRGVDNERQLLEAEQLLTVTQGMNARRFGFCNRDLDCLARLPEYDDKFASFVLAPQVPRGSSWSGFVEVLRDTIEESVGRFGIDRRRIYAVGFSMGGFGLFDVLEAYPDLLAAGVSVAGGGNTQAVENFGDAPIWFFHGEDDPTVPVSSSVSMHEALVAAGADSQLSVLPERGHLIIDEVLTSPDYSLYNWMFTQVRVPEAATIQMAILAFTFSLASCRRRTFSNGSSRVV